MTLLEKIDYLIKERGLNKRRLSIQCGIPYSTIDGFYKVGYENMRLPTFIKLCDFFDVTMESMAYDDKDIVYKKDLRTRDNLERDEVQILSDYNKLNSSGRTIATGTIRSLATNEEYIKDTPSMNAG